MPPTIRTSFLKFQRFQMTIERTATGAEKPESSMNSYFLRVRTLFCSGIMDNSTSDQR